METISLPEVRHDLIMHLPAGKQSTFDFFQNLPWGDEVVRREDVLRSEVLRECDLLVAGTSTKHEVVNVVANTRGRHFEEDHVLSLLFALWRRTSWRDASESIVELTDWPGRDFMTGNLIMVSRKVWVILLWN